MRLIDADEAIKRAECFNWDTTAINNAPTVDAVPVRHGKWITDFIERNSSGVRPHYLYCSECHHSQYSRQHMPKYCPNCGAKMEEYELERKKNE